MKILVINPNSSPEMTADIDRSAKEYANGEFEVDTLPTKGAPVYIDTYLDAALAQPGMIQTVRENEDKYDAFVVACHCDPNLDLLKEITTKPVVGIGEASMKMASMIGHSFSVVSTGNRSTPNKLALIHKYHLDGYAASVRSPGENNVGCDSCDLFMDAAKRAIEEDMAEVIVLGCAGMCGLPKLMQAELGVPVLDGVVCALIIASGMVKANITTSKKRRYSPLSE
ncbi:MAG: aspartate/glutamate racemase family protein [Clostridiaceae bacterium]